MIECPKCQTRYRVDVPDTGQKMRCARCGEIWHALPVFEHEPAYQPQPQPDARSRQDLHREQEETSEPAQGFEPPGVQYSAADTYRAYKGSDAGPPEAGTAQWDTYNGEHAARHYPAGEHIGEAFAGAAPDYGHQQQYLPSEQGQPPKPEDQYLRPQDQHPDSQQNLDTDKSAEIAGSDGEAPPLNFAQSEEARAAAAARAAPAPQSLTEKIKTNTAWAGLVGVLVGVLMAAGIFRTQIVRALPGMAGVYALVGLDVNVRGLSFKDVRYRWEGGQGSGILTIEGEIVNVTSDAVKVPPILAELSDKSGFVFYRTNKVVRYVALDSGERSYFSLTIRSPPRAEELAEVRLHFRMDLL